MEICWVLWCSVIISAKMDVTSHWPALGNHERDKSPTNVFPFTVTSTKMVAVDNKCLLLGAFTVIMYFMWMDIALWYHLQVSPRQPEFTLVKIMVLMHDLGAMLPWLLMQGWIDPHPYYGVFPDTAHSVGAMSSPPPTIRPDYWTDSWSENDIWYPPALNCWIC